MFFSLTHILVDFKASLRNLNESLLETKIVILCMPQKSASHRRCQGLSTEETVAKPGVHDCRGLSIWVTDQNKMNYVTSIPKSPWDQAYQMMAYNLAPFSLYLPGCFWLQRFPHPKTSISHHYSKHLVLFSSMDPLDTHIFFNLIIHRLPSRPNFKFFRIFCSVFFPKAYYKWEYKQPTVLLVQPECWVPLKFCLQYYFIHSS